MAEISIIIPVYNSSKYLEKCFESIRLQTFTDFEVIAINDGSTDNSGNICDKFALLDTRFKIIHKKNEGVSVARNTGIEQSCGRYITFIDSDDWIDEDYLHNLDNESYNNADLVVSGIIREYNDSSQKNLNICDKFFSSREASWLHILVKSRLLFGPCNKLYKTSIIKDYNLTFPLNISYGEDRIFNYEYLKHVSTIRTISYSGYHYRQSSGNSLTTISRINMFELEYSQWQLLNEAYKNKEAFNQEVQQDQYIDLFWIIHDNIFANRLQGIKYLHVYIKKLLTTPEISNIKRFEDQIKYNKIIKYCILNRKSLLLHSVIQILNLCKK